MARARPACSTRSGGRSPGRATCRPCRFAPARSERSSSSTSARSSSRAPSPARARTTTRPRSPCAAPMDPRSSHRRRCSMVMPELEEVEARAKAELTGIEQQIAALQRQSETVAAQLGVDKRRIESRLRDEAATFTTKADELEAKLNGAEPLPAIVDTAAIVERMSKARIVNANVERARLRTLHLATAKK